MCPPRLREADGTVVFAAQSARKQGCWPGGRMLRSRGGCGRCGWRWMLRRRGAPWHRRSGSSSLPSAPPATPSRRCRCASLCSRVQAGSGQGPRLRGARRAGTVEACCLACRKILPWELGQSPAALRFWQSPEAAAAKPHPASAVSGCLGRTDASVLQLCNPSGQRSVSNPAAARVGQDSLQRPGHHPKPAQQTKRPVAYGPIAPPFWLQQPQHPQQIQQLQQLGPLSGRLASRSSCQTPGSASVCTVIVAAFGFAPMLGHWQDLGNASMGSRPQPARPRVPHVALPDAPRVLPPRARCRGCGDWRSPT